MKKRIEKINRTPITVRDNIKKSNTNGNYSLKKEERQKRIFTEINYSNLIKNINIHKKFNKLQAK